MSATFKMAQKWVCNVVYLCGYFVCSQRVTKTNNKANGVNFKENYARLYACAYVHYVVRVCAYLPPPHGFVERKR
jgi:hypothetical protein